MNPFVFGRPRFVFQQSGLLLLILLSSPAVSARGDEDPPTDSQKYQAFAKQAAGYVIREQGTGRQLELRSESLLNWANPVRQQERGSVFVWLARGRPEAIGSVFTYELNGTAYDKHEFHSLSDQPLVMTRNDQTAWTPKARAAEWRTLEDAPHPAPSDRQRLVEMRSLARRFRVRLSDPRGDRSELRLMPQPLFRYSAREEKVLDGAIFSFVVATDPEALLLIEAAGAPGEERWRFAFARFHYWALAAELDARPVWSVEPDESQALHFLGDTQHLEKPYVSFHPRARSSN